MYALHIRTGSLAPKKIDVRAPLFVVGRAPDCDLQLFDGGISQRHAAFERQADGVYVHDLKSANGVFVNRQRVERQRLRSGDEIEMASVRIRFEILHEPPPPKHHPSKLVVAAGLVIAAILAGQAVLIWQFSREKRPKHADRLPARVEKSAVETIEAPMANVPSSAPRPTAPVATPQILAKQVKIVSVNRADDASGVAFTAALQTQVAEKNFDPSAITVEAQIFLRDAAGNVVPSPAIVRFSPETAAPTQNFSRSRWLARANVRAEMLHGAVVRTFYRGELQDQMASPPDLLTR
jgi:predicted component of type VI protein secretion system